MTSTLPGNRAPAAGSTGSAGHDATPVTLLDRLASAANMIQVLAVVTVLAVAAKLLLIDRSLANLPLLLGTLPVAANVFMWASNRLDDASAPDEEFPIEARSARHRSQT